MKRTVRTTHIYAPLVVDCPGTRAYLLAAVAVLRGAIGLFLHGIRRPGQPARLCRRTGRVRPE